jgi:hypothetical protein
VGIASTDPNLVQASAPAADANLTGYLLLEKALKLNFMKESTAFLGLNRRSSEKSGKFTNFFKFSLDIQNRGG